MYTIRSPVPDAPALCPGLDNTVWMCAGERYTAASGGGAVAAVASPTSARPRKARQGAVSTPCDWQSGIHPDTLRLRPVYVSSSIRSAEPSAFGPASTPP